jgi:hypothetical protein
MPMAAARLADIGAGDPHPLEIRRRGQHLPQQLPLSCLCFAALAKRDARLPDPRRQAVAQLLQLPQAEHPRLLRGAGDGGIDPHSREGRDEEACELVLEAADLAPQLSTGKALIAPHPKR